MAAADNGVHRDGGFSDYACVPAKNAWRIPEAISDRQATMVEPFTIAANITAQLQPTAQDIALVYGAGPMGLTIIQALKGVYGVKQVIVVDRIAERLQMARENGADLTLDNTDQRGRSRNSWRSGSLPPRWSLMPPATRRSCRKPFSSPPPPPASVYSVSPARPRPSLSKASPVKKFLFSPPG